MEFTQRCASSSIHLEFLFLTVARSTRYWRSCWLLALFSDRHRGAVRQRRVLVFADTIN